MFNFPYILKADSSISEIYDDHIGSYVPTAIWTAAEASTAVICACLPSLRPLFVRAIFWRSNPRVRRVPTTSYYHPSFLSSSFSRNKEKSRNPFDRLADFSGHERQPSQGEWANSAAAYAGRRGHTQDEFGEEYNLGGGPGQLEGERPMSTMMESEVPAGRIRAKTEVVISISDRVDWRDDLF